LAAHANTANSELDAPGEGAAGCEAPSASGIVHDVPVRVGVPAIVFALGIILIVSIVMLVLLIWLIFGVVNAVLPPGAAGWVTVWTVIAAIAMCVLGVLALVRGNSRRFVEATGGVESTAALKDALTKRSSELLGCTDTSQYKRLAQVLVNRGYAGLTLRISPEREAVRVVPLTVNFEPLPTDETHPAVASLLEEADGAALTRADRAASDADAAASAGRFRRWLAHNGGWVYLVVLIPLISEGFRSWANGAPTFAFLVVAASFWISLVGYFVTGGIGANALVVPGGLIAPRRRGWGRASQEPRLLARRECVLISVSLPISAMCVVYVADAGAQAVQFLMTRRELEFALRAWTSPLPPPSAEMVQGLG